MSIAHVSSLQALTRGASLRSVAVPSSPPCRASSRPPNEDVPVLTLAAVRELVASQFPQWADLSVMPGVSAGTDHDLFRLGSDKVVRLPRAPRAVAQVRKEQIWLGAVKDNLPLRIPSLLGCGRESTIFSDPWSVYSWIHGTDATSLQLRDPAGDAVRLGRFVRQLRTQNSTNIPLAGDENNWRGADLLELDNSTQAAIRQLNALRIVDRDDAAMLRSIWKRSLNTGEWREDSVLVHGDLHPGNLIVDADRLTGVIDFGLLASGDPAVNLLPAWWLFSQEHRQSFIHETEILDEATVLRWAGWALCVAVHALVSVESSKAVLSSARVALREVMSDIDKHR